MDLHAVTNLTDYQLFELSQNDSLNEKIRLAAQLEFDNRNIPYEQMADIMRRHYLNLTPQSIKDLEWRYKALFILFPFFFSIVYFFIAHYPARGRQKEWNSFWRYTEIGFWLWTIGMMLVLLMRR